jgi:UDP-N-acetylmuramyl pentapeptide phosphotransferase/UDP-N-acetylglucosamine-1-phosphate transferase
MLSIIIAFFVSFIITLGVIRSKCLHARFSADSDQEGPQKFHLQVVPRIGGLGIALGVTLAILLRSVLLEELNPADMLLIFALPVFLVGFMFH